MEKLLLRADRPSAGIEWADRLGVVDRLFPELAALKGCPQDPDWHPEGDVWVHTLLSSIADTRCVRDWGRSGGWR